MQLFVSFLTLQILIYTAAIKAHGNIASTNSLNGFWTQVRSGCNLNLSAEDILNLSRENNGNSISNGTLDLQDGSYNIYFSRGKACDLNSKELIQYITDLKENAYCGEKLHNQGRFEKMTGKNNYYFEGRKILYTLTASLGMGSSIKRYNLELITPLILKKTYTRSLLCIHQMVIYYIAAPT